MPSRKSPESPKSPLGSGNPVLLIEPGRFRGSDLMPSLRGIFTSGGESMDFGASRRADGSELSAGEAIVETLSIGKNLLGRDSTARYLGPDRAKRHKTMPLTLMGGQQRQPYPAGRPGFRLRLLRTV